MEFEPMTLRLRGVNSTGGHTHCPSLFLTPTLTIASLRQGTWLTRPDPQPQIESTLSWDPD